MKHKSNTWIIFDMDGTLWDTTDLIVEAWNTTYRQFEETRNLQITRDDLLGYMGMPMDAFAKAMIPNEPLPRAMEIMQECMTLENQWLTEKGAYLYPGLVSTIEELRKRGYKIGIISNCQEGYIEAFLNHYDFWHLIDDKLCWGDTREGKEKNLVTMKNKHKIETCYYVGDTAGDYNACKEAGVPFVYADYGFGEVTDEVETIHELAELLTIFS